MRNLYNPDEMKKKKLNIIQSVVKLNFKYSIYFNSCSKSGSELTLTAALVCFPVFSKIDDIKSEAPLITWLLCKTISRIYISR